MKLYVRTLSTTCSGISNVSLFLPKRHRSEHLDNNSNIHCIIVIRTSTRHVTDGIATLFPINNNNNMRLKEVRKEIYIGIIISYNSFILIIITELC